MGRKHTPRQRIRAWEIDEYGNTQPRGLDDLADEVFKLKVERVETVIDWPEYVNSREQIDNLNAQVKQLVSVRYDAWAEENRQAARKEIDSAISESGLDEGAYWLL